MSTITCAISKLPILPGEEMVCVPLRFKSQYQMKEGHGRIETKSLMVYSTDAFFLMGLAFKGIAGKNEVFDTIFEDGNTKCLEERFKMPIKQLADVFVQKEKKTHPELNPSIAIFIKKPVFDYLSKDRPPSFNWGKTLEEKYDELQEGIKKWNAKKDVKPADAVYDDDNPFGMMGEYKFELLRDFDDSIFSFKHVYREGLKENTIRTSLIETYNFLVNLNDIGFYFFPVLESHSETDKTLNKSIYEASVQILKEKEARHIEESEMSD
ncbi:hypothetical protein JMA_42030 (plasmid) [Jeotgalibacillus malaysiensis]|uniref:Uncharacterized protein n=1 Tax=Jeotgalibacillus malaysiensis TaxID=1508404 RepID=A0A0B5ATH5_9BACL|nr:hypothetical protein [Jeotgalibacillus malaysiensis]AJD93520.1 hypothetical protein JMA_42030 [Jeotgalibacillus malaysiensis]